jgi:hypothetical protein
MSLKRPTKELIEEYLVIFNRRNEKSENAIQMLCEKFPNNRSFEGVLLKSIVINALYSTQILAIKPVAEQIVALDIDDDIQNGASDVVDRIARVTIKGKQRNNYSFATKYCNFHNPDAYPIYDSYVVKILTAYKKQDGFAEFREPELKDYARFKQVLDQFKHFYGLAEVSLKKLDIFLWGYGKELFG